MHSAEACLLTLPETLVRLSSAADSADFIRKRCIFEHSMLTCIRVGCSKEFVALSTYLDSAFAAGNMHDLQRSVDRNCL